MTRVFLSPSDQDNNIVVGGRGNEQQFATVRCGAAARVLRSAGVEVKISEAGRGNDSGGFAQSIAEGNAWGCDLYFADHTNATGSAVKASGIQMYCYLPDPASVALGKAIARRLDPIVPGGWSIQDGGHLGEVASTHATAVLGESGYHDNETDAEVIASRAVEMGEAIGFGILDHLGITSGVLVPDPAPAPAPAQDPAPVRVVATTPARERPQPLHAFDLAPGEYYGLITGPDESHGGYHGWERRTVRLIQQWLIFLGFVPGISRIDSGWADGVFEQPTADAVAAFQRAHMAGRTDFPGQVWGDDWAKLIELTQAV